MGAPSHHSPALLLIAAFSRHAGALDWAQRRAVETFGPLALASEPFEFNETNYYQPTMGPDIKKCFWVFQQPFDAAELPRIKLLTNQWELDYAAECAARRAAGDQDIPAETRPLNLDPGYLTVAKLVLASTKDHAHRIYLAQGIFAEITLFYRHGRWEHHEWTFPDYRRADYHAFFTQARNWLRGKKE